MGETEGKDRPEQRGAFVVRLIVRSIWLERVRARSYSESIFSRVPYATFNFFMGLILVRDPNARGHSDGGFASFVLLIYGEI